MDLPWLYEGPTQVAFAANLIHHFDSLIMLGVLRWVRQHNLAWGFQEGNPEYCSLVPIFDGALVNTPMAKHWPEAYHYGFRSLGDPMDTLRDLVMRGVGPHPVLIRHLRVWSRNRQQPWEA